MIKEPFKEFIADVGTSDSLDVRLLKTCFCAGFMAGYYKATEAASVGLGTGMKNAEKDANEMVGVVGNDVH